MRSTNFFVTCLALAASACSSSDPSPSFGSGGTVANGGNAATGGNTTGSANATGGNLAMGGAATGGNLAMGGAAIGGSANTGGSATNTGGKASGGGALATGGAIVTGGATATGGAATNGGTATGGKATGGAATNGGTATGGKATGGAVATGGKATGGAVATGGKATGGAVATGGKATGGATATGGSGTCTPNYSCQPTAPNTGDFYADCVARVNQFRACVCLGPLTRNTAAEACANQQAQYDATRNSAHAGISAGICTPASMNNAAQNECPGWDSTQSTVDGCTLMMFQEGSCSDFNTCGHYINMTDTNATSLACGYYTTSSGSVWMVQNFY